MDMLHIKLQGATGAYMFTPFVARYLMPKEFNERANQLSTDLFAQVKITPEQETENRSKGEEIYKPTIPIDLQQRIDGLQIELERDLPIQIKEKYARSSEVYFSARRFNHFEYREVSVDGVNCLISLELFCASIGLGALKLKPVFGGKPRTQRDFKELGWFPLHEKPFTKLAKILRKPVRVMRESGSTGEHYYLFTAHPDGSITKLERV